MRNKDRYLILIHFLFFQKKCHCVRFNLKNITYKDCVNVAVLYACHKPFPGASLFSIYTWLVVKTGINIVNEKNGKVSYKGVADAFNLGYTPLEVLLQQNVYLTIVR